MQITIKLQQKQIFIFLFLFFQTLKFSDRAVNFGKTNKNTRID